MTEFLVNSPIPPAALVGHGDSELMRLRASFQSDAEEYLSSLYEDVELIKHDPEELLKIATVKSHPTETVSIKTMNRSKLSFETEMFLVQEINLLKDLQHPNIIQLVDCIILPSSYTVVYEYFSGEDLGQKILNRKAYNELQARNWIQGIFDAVKFCHERNIIHRYNFCFFHFHFIHYDLFSYVIFFLEILIPLVSSSLDRMMRIRSN